MQRCLAQMTNWELYSTLVLNNRYKLNKRKEQDMANGENAKMEVAEALTDCTRSLDRSRRRLEELESTIQKLDESHTSKEAIAKLRVMIVDIQKMNNQLRGMDIL